jgi:hypothetical protein
VRTAYATSELAQRMQPPRISWSRVWAHRELGALAPRRPATVHDLADVHKSPGPVGLSLYDAERKMSDPSSLDHSGALQLDGLCTQVVEQSYAVPEQDWH